jgi:hypothetical protein
MLNEFDEYGGTKRSKGLPLPLMAPNGHGAAVAAFG